MNSDYNKPCRQGQEDNIEEFHIGIKNTEIKWMLGEGAIPSYQTPRKAWLFYTGINPASHQALRQITLGLLAGW